MKLRGLVLGAVLLGVSPAWAGTSMFEASLDCVKPRLDLMRGICADPELRDLARVTQDKFDKARLRLKAQPYLLKAVEAINASFVSSLMVFFDNDRMQPSLALRRHMALLDAIQPAAGKGLQGHWAGDSTDLVVTGSSRLSARMRSQGFGQNAYDCGWQARVLPRRGGWITDTGPKNADLGIFHVTMTREGPALNVETPEQSERAPDDCPPWASFSGPYLPVSGTAGLARMPGWILPQRNLAGEKQKTIDDFLRLLPGPALPEHAPDLSREILTALVSGKPVEGWTMVRPKADVIDIARDGRKDRVVFQFADQDRKAVEVIAYHDASYHLAEWHERADGRTMHFSVPPLKRAVQRLFLTTRGGFKDGLPREGLPVSNLQDDLKEHVERLETCRYFGELRKAGPFLSQSEIDTNRASARCSEREKLEEGIRERRGQYPDAMRVLDLSNRLATE